MNDPLNPPSHRDWKIPGIMKAAAPGRGRGPGSGRDSGRALRVAAVPAAPGSPLTTR